MRRGVSQLLSIVILVIIVLGASAIIYVNFSRLIVEQERDLRDMLNELKKEKYEPY